MVQVRLAALGLALWVGATLSCSAGSAGTQPTSAPVEIVFLHINDTHGKTVGSGSGGGYGRLATLVEGIRAESKAARVFLVDCGDVISRGDDLTRLTHGAANFTVMNYLRFDAWVPGNGDFYDGLDVLQARIRQAKFPVLAANVSVKSTGQCIARPYVIERIGDVKVAILGLCLVRHEGPLALPVKVEAPMATARRLVPELRRQADLVVAMTHIGVLDDMELARNVPGLDLILGGHSHTHLRSGVTVAASNGGSTLVCQAGDELNSLGMVKIQMMPENGKYKVAVAVARTIPLDQTVKIDPQVTALIARLSEATSRPASHPAVK